MKTVFKRWTCVDVLMKRHSLRHPIKNTAGVIEGIIRCWMNPVVQAINVLTRQYESKSKWAPQTLLLFKADGCYSEFPLWTHNISKPFHVLCSPGRSSSLTLKLAHHRCFSETQTSLQSLHIRSYCSCINTGWFVHFNSTNLQWFQILCKYTIIQNNFFTLNIHLGVFYVILYLYLLFLCLSVLIYSDPSLRLTLIRIC